MMGQGQALSPATVDLRPGQKVGEYEVQRLLGRGGMGAVYLGVQPQIGKRVAIKVLSSHVSTEENAARFLREAQVVNRIGHPGLVDIFSFGQLPSGQPYLVMELLSGETLATRLQRAPLPWSELSVVFTQMLSALGAAHEGGVVHRDLKPDNVFLVPGEGGPRVKLLDFGLAKVLDDDVGMTQTGIALGTPRYMAPEQSRGGRHVDHRVDIYAAGLMLYEAVTGRFPFDAPTAILMLTIKLSQDPAPPSEHAVLPPALEALILRALHKDPAARFQSAREMAAALAAIGPPTAGIAIERRAPLSLQRTVALDPVREPGLEGEATRVSAPDLPAAALDNADAMRLSRSDERYRVSRPPRPPVGLSEEKTRLSMGSPRSPVRAPRRGSMLIAAACAAVLLGALSAIVLRVALQRPQRGRVPDAVEQHEPAAPPPSPLGAREERAQPGPAPSPSPPDAGAAAAPPRPKAPPRRAKRSR